MATQSDIDGWIKSRSGHKGHITQAHNEIKRLEREQKCRRWQRELRDHYENALKHYRKAKELTKKVVDAYQTIDQDEAKKEKLTLDALKTQINTITKDYKDQEDEYEEEKEDERKRDSQSFLASLVSQLAGQPPPGSQASRVQGGGLNTAPPPKTVKLPTIIITPFEGDRMQWTSFWEQFKVAVDDAALTDVEKLSYLRSYLRGEALQSLDGLALTAANYTKAKQQLEKEYGRKELLIESHIQKLSTLPLVTDATDITALKNLQRTIICNINSLDTLGHPATNYGTLLGATILKSIPREFQAEWSKVSTNKITDLPRIIAFLGEQIEAKERFQQLRGQPKQQNQGKRQGQQGSPPPPNQQQQVPSAMALPVEVKQGRNGRNQRGTQRVSFADNRNNNKGTMPQRKCPFCPETHWPDKCPVPLKNKLEIVRKDKLCAKCFRNNHLMEQCFSTKVCYTCHAKDHNTALCGQTSQAAGEARDVTAAVAQVTGDVLLKTATILVFGPKGVKRALCLVDDGSQRSFIRTKLAEELALPIIGEEPLRINPFGKKKPEKKEFMKKRRVKFRGTFKSAPLIELDIVQKDVVCGASEYVKTEFAKKLRKEGKYLADDRFFEGKDEFEELDILIGADLIWQVAGREQIDSSSGMRAMSSKLGWLFLGPSNAPATGGGVVSGLVRCLRDAPLQTEKAQIVTSLACHVTTEKEEKTEERTPIESQEEEKEKQESHKRDGFDLELFWKLEAYGIAEDATNLDWLNRLKEYEEKIEREESGRYCSALPWLHNKWQLENNFALADTRLNGLLKSIRRTPSLLRDYDEEIKNLEANNFIQKVPFGDWREFCVYLPHHPVIREDKETTKIRPVFDGSAKGRNRLSLNDCLDPGPNLNPDLTGVLMRWRLKKVAWIADIEKAFLNIALPEEDAQAIRFLWTSDPADPKAPRIAYRWNRLPFGLTSSPFVLRATISKHLRTFKTKFPDLVTDIEAQLYVDDLLGGADSVEEAKEAVLDTKSIFSEAKFKMTKWKTSSEELQEILGKEGLTQPAEGILAKNLSEGNPKVLGVAWDTKTDSFVFDPTEIMKAAKDIGEFPTKRNILQVSSRIFDPMGFLAPTVLSLKILFQKLWQTEIGWDDKVPPDISKKWKKIMAGLDRLNEVKIKRWLGTGPSSGEPTELHVFGDASLDGYGAVAYIRHKVGDGYKIELLCSKTVVAPLPKRKVSLARLELLSSLIAVRLGETIKNALKDRVWRTTYWSDSKVALGWIRGDSNRWDPFVKNRVDKIQEFSGPEWWRHCPGLENPADPASRGTTAAGLVESPLWWHGPQWLSRDESEWPIEEETLSEEEKLAIAEERKRKVTFAAVVMDVTPKETQWNVERIGTWTKLIRRTAWMLRFGLYGREERPPEEINGKVRVIVPQGEGTIEKRVNALRAEEIRNAELTIIRMLQKERYPDSFEALSSGEILHPRAKLTRLRPIWDARDRVIRVTGRMELAIREREAEPPILLPANHPVVDLLVTATHRRILHAGLRSTHSELRENYWVVKGRQQVKRVLNKCVICKKLQSRPFDELAAPMPVERIRKARPFDQCGVDFAGPLYYKPFKFEQGAAPDESSESEDRAEGQSADDGPPPLAGVEPEAGEAAPTQGAAAEVASLEELETGPDLQKAYICLFTCAYTRAVHLELVRDLSAATFILALRRFFNATGGCTKMFSDNAQTFACVSKYLRAMRTNEKICDLLAHNKVDWQFSAALAPWWGGFWERMVRTVKELFRKANGKAVLNFDQLHTALTDVQAVINSRPLAYVVDGDREAYPLTPNHILQGHPPCKNMRGPPPDPEDYATATALIKMDQDRRDFVSSCVDQLVKEYLGELTLFHAKGKPSRPIRLGEVVVVHDANAKRLMWTTGVVKELLVGRDGRVRSVKLKIPSGSILTRAIQCLHPIELQEDQPDRPQPIQPVQPEPENQDQHEESGGDEMAETNPPPPPVMNEEEPSGSGGEYVGSIYRRRPGGRQIRLTERALANRAGER